MSRGAMGSTCLKRFFAPWCPVSQGHSQERAPVRGFTAVEPRKTPTSNILARLKTVKNIRDLSEACGNIAPGRIFRSACPVGATPEDVHYFRQSLKINRLIDLRSDYERKQDVSLQEGLLSQALVLRHSRTGNDEVMVQADEALETGDDTPSSKSDLKVDLLSLLERDRYYRAMLTRVPYLTAASLLFWGLFNQSHAKRLAIREINKAGLSGLYETILETAGPEIKRALEVVVESAEANIPILFFCKVGKDRTGLLASLILACCGATPEEIVSDYARSDGVDQVALGGMEKDKELKELDVAMFARAPPEAMQSTLNHFQQRYGGMRGYLDSIGFSHGWQRRLAKSLAPEGKECANGN